MRIGKIFLIPLLFLCFAASVSAKEDLKVWADKCGGNFDKQIEVNLISNNPEAKIFWTLNPNDSPAKGFIYNQPIKIEKDAELYFFAFTATDNATLYQICNYQRADEHKASFFPIVRDNFTLSLKAFYYSAYIFSKL